jgi:hypothetical protein
MAPLRLLRAGVWVAFVCQNRHILLLPCGQKLALLLALALLSI